MLSFTHLSLCKARHPPALSTNSLKQLLQESLSTPLQRCLPIAEDGYMQEKFTLLGISRHLLSKLRA